MTHYLMNKPGYWGKVPSDLEGLRATAEMEGIDFSMHVIGEEMDDAAPVALVVRIPPNTPLPRHAHVGYRFEVVLEGSIKFGDEWLKPGDVMTAREQEAYGPLATGPDGATTVEIFSVRRGAYEVFYENANGDMQFVNALDPAAAAAAVADFRAASS